MKTYTVGTSADQFLASPVVAGEAETLGALREDSDTRSEHADPLQAYDSEGRRVCECDCCAEHLGWDRTGEGLYLCAMCAGEVQS